MPGGRRASALLLAAAAVAGCGGEVALSRSAAPGAVEAAAVVAGPTVTVPSAPAGQPTTTAVAVPPTTVAAVAAPAPASPPLVALPPPPSTSPAAAAVPAPTTTTSPARTRVVVEQAWTPFATVEGVVLHHPSARVERVAFHEANHDGARQLEPLPTAADPVTLESRERGTGSRSAADVVSDPDAEVRSPVTGTVLRAGTYTLYCDHRDDFAVIEPDARPGWEVKVLHVDGVRVAEGDRVEAGITVLAGRPTRLPFESQVDETTAPPAWPHVHVEVVDPSIPDRPGKGGGC